MSFETDAHIKALTKAFRACTLPKERWTHAAHWAGALCLLSEDEHAAFRDMPGMIRAFNESVGGQNTDCEGYHETITIASLRVAAHALTSAPDDMPLHEILSRLLAGPYGKPDWLLEYWRKDTLFNKKARREWIDPFFPFREGAVATARHDNQSVTLVEGHQVTQLELATIGLQLVALAARHLRQLIQRENQQFPVRSDHGQHITLYRHADVQLTLAGIHGLLAGLAVGFQLFLCDDETIALAGSDDAFAVRLKAEHRDNVDTVFQINGQADRLAVSASTRQLVRRQRKGPSVGCHEDNLVRTHHFFGKVEFVTILELG